jgi:hypothetical protein
MKKTLLMKKSLFMFGVVVLVFGTIALFAWAHWSREWGMFWLGILLGGVLVGGITNVITSIFMKDIHEVSLRNHYCRYECEYDVYTIRNGYPSTSPSSAVKVEYLKGGKLEFKRTDKRGNIWVGTADLTGKDDGKVFWQFKGRSGSVATAQHHFFNQQIKLIPEDSDAHDELMPVIYLLGISESESERELLIPKGRLLRKSQPIRTSRRFRRLDELGESRSERRDPSMG